MSARDFVHYDKYGGVSIDLAGYLQTPEGRAQLASIGRIPLPIMTGNKLGDTCQHCGNPWLPSPGGGIWHNCHT